MSSSRTANASKHSCGATCTRFRRWAALHATWSMTTWPQPWRNTKGIWFAFILFLAFAREFGFLPRACHVASPWEKGKVERAGIGYLRQNFWPLRTFTDLADVNRQVRQWLD